MRGPAAAGLHLGTGLRRQTQEVLESRLLSRASRVGFASTPSRVPLIPQNSAQRTTEEGEVGFRVPTGEEGGSASTARLWEVGSPS